MTLDNVAAPILLTPTNLRQIILDALRKGLKLYQILREPGMPPMSQVDEWRKDKDFNRRFIAACEDGRALRNEQEPGVDHSRPAVLRGSHSARLATQPISDFVRKTSPLTPPVMQVLKEEQAPQEMQAPPAPQESPAARGRKESGTYLYLQPSSSTTKPVRFQRTCKGVSYGLSIGVKVEEAHWNNEIGLAAPSHPNADALNRELRAADALVNEAILDGRTEAEIRALFKVGKKKPGKVGATRVRLPHGPHTMRRRDDQPDLSEPGSSDNADADREGYWDEQRATGNDTSSAPAPEPVQRFLTPEPMPEETPAAEPVAAAGSFMVEDLVFVSEDVAMLCAWDLSKRNGRPTTIYRLTPQPIGVVNANPLAA